MARKTASSRKRTAPDREKADTKSARTRARVLDAAAHVLSIKGYSGMRLSDVAEYAEIQAPAIYYYFASREELIEEVMWAGLADMREHLVTVLAEADADLDPMGRLMVAVEAHLRHSLGVSDYTTASIRNAGQLPESIRKRQRQEEVKYGEIWKDLIAAADDAGQVRKDLDLYIAQMLVMGALNWAAEWWSPKRGSLDTVVSVAQSFVRNGLAA